MSFPRGFFCTLSILLGIFLSGNAQSQCTGCTVTITNNGLAGYTVTDNSVVCIRFNRSNPINLSNRNNVTVCVDEGFTFSGNFTGYTNTNRLTVNVYGTFRGDLILNNAASSFNVFSTGAYNNAGTLTVTNGSVNNLGTISRPVLLSNSSSYNNQGNQSGAVTLNNNASFTNSGIKSDLLTLNNSATFLNSGTKNGNLTVNNSGTVTNSGAMTVPTLSLATVNTSFTNSSTGTLTVSNTATLRGIVNISGTANFSNNVTLQDLGTNLTVSNGGQMNISGALTVGPNALVNVTNASNGIPQTTLSAASLTFPNNGGSNNREFFIGPNSNVSVSNDTNLDTDRAVMNIQGNFETGRDLVVSNNGGTSPVRINLNGNGSLNVGRDAIINRDIVASGNSSFTVDRDFRMANTSSYSFNISDNVTFTVNGNTEINRLLNVSGTSSIFLNGNLNLPNVGSASITLNDDVSLVVRGTATVNRPFVFNDNVVATFESNVDLPNVGGAAFEVNNNGDVLIQGNLNRTGSSATINVRNSGSLVICNDRAPNGDIEGLFPPATAPNVNISPIPAFYGGCRILPVEFNYFDVVFRRENRKVLVTWATAKEWNNSHFEIQRSDDGLKTWKTLDNVPGKGWSD
ncbi:hypothetical protein, partial [Mariniradius saccharolyticus]|uniref:beta strand repeat-containing protein n=1 Tax=Mariniradius saccharolyticus TaxID=1245591 RepID=UPI0014614B22